MRVPKWATGAAIVAVLGAWVATLVVDILVDTYSPPPGIEPLMMALAAFLFATQTKRDKDEETTSSAEIEDDEHD